MLFNSFQFLFVFFPILTVLYFAVPHRFRWALLLMGGVYFYMAFIPKYIVILMALILIDYAAGLLIERAQGASRKRWLLLSLMANVGMLGVFKYYNFLADNVTALMPGSSIPHLHWALPIGLSFHTFQSMSYTIEVYRGRFKAERHLGIYALYVLFYPQLVAGPIERPQNLLPQLHAEHGFDAARVADGLKLMLWGLFKKVVIADRLAVLVDAVYNQPTAYGGAVLAAATVAFAFQIYCDFSGYSDMAIGAAQVMGINLMRNFARPYLAASIAEFWQRWHISLSTWFRDYVYIPLGGNRVSLPRWCVNVLVTFVISGLWHGAGWTYIIWGALNGLYLIGERLLKISLPRAAGVACTFVLTCFAWIFFRANSLTDALYVATHLFSPEKAPLPMPTSDVTLAALTVALLLAIQLLQERHIHIRQWLATRPVWLRWSVYYAALLTILFLGSYESRQFIYFQF